MSKIIDPEEMSPEDVVYVKQRSSLHREFLLQGLGDPTVEGYEGHDFEWSTYFDEQGNLRPEPLEDSETESEEDRLRREEEEARQRAEEEQRKAEEAQQELEARERAAAAEEGSGPDDANHNPDTPVEPEELPEAKQWSNSMNKGELQNVIDARNADYDDDEKIVLENKKPSKDELVAALEQDDRELGLENDEGTEE